MSGFPIHKRHTGFLRPFEAGQVLVVVDDLLIRFHLFRLERPAGGAVHRQVVGKLEAGVSMFDNPVRPVSRDYFGPGGTQRTASWPPPARG